MCVSDDGPDTPLFVITCMWRSSDDQLAVDIRGFNFHEAASILRQALMRVEDEMEEPFLIYDDETAAQYEAGEEEDEDED